MHAMNNLQMQDDLNRSMTEVQQIREELAALTNFSPHMLQHGACVLVSRPVVTTSVLCCVVLCGVGGLWSGNTSKRLASRTTVCLGVWVSCFHVAFVNRAFRADGG